MVALIGAVVPGGQWRLLDTFVALYGRVPQTASQLPLRDVIASCACADLSRSDSKFYFEHILWVSFRRICFWDLITTSVLGVGVEFRLVVSFFNQRSGTASLCYNLIFQICTRQTQFQRKQSN